VYLIASCAFNEISLTYQKKKKKKINGIQLIEKHGKEFQLPIMGHSSKINVPQRRNIRELKMISHVNILEASNAIQLQKRCLMRPLPTPHIVLKTNLRAITHLKSRKLLSTLPNEFPETHSLRPKDFIRAPPTTLTAIFNGHYPSPKSLSHRRNGIRERIYLGPAF
jgi:hypothetical protein